MSDYPDGLVLDTSVVVAYLRDELDLLGLAGEATFLFLPLVALGELYKGALASNRPQENRRQVDEFLALTALLHPDAATAEVYARVSVQLKRKGRPIPENDVWIAAVALECRLPLVTRDAHFGAVDGLDLLHW